MSKKRESQQAKPFPAKTLLVDIDWGSTGIWTKQGNAPYANYNLPAWLVSRFHYWTGWYNSHAPWDGETIDNDMHDAYGMSLAVDLKRVVGNRYHVIYRDKEIVLVDDKKVRQSVPPDRRRREGI